MGSTTNFARLAAAGLALVLFACERPPVTPPEQHVLASVNLEGFINDRYALGAKWYVYDSHILTPKDEVYVVAFHDAVPTRYYAFEITSFYDAVTAESAHFTIHYVSYEAGWSAPATLVLSHSAYVAPPMCVDLGAGAEVDCAGDAWQLVFTSVRYLAPISVHKLPNNPGVWIRSTSGQPDRGGVRLAVVAAAGLADVTVDPSTLGELVEAPADGVTTEYDHALYAPNLPENGMVLGRSWYDASGAATEHVIFVRTYDDKLVKLTLLTPAPAVPPASVTLRFQVADDEIVVEDGIPAHMVDFAGVPVREATLTLPAAYGVSYVDFTADPVEVALAGDLVRSPPSSDTWDLAFETTAAGVAALVSPGSIAWDWTADPAGGNGSTDFDAAAPPVYTE